MSIAKAKNKQQVITNNNLPLVFLILDGWGIAKPNRGNAITLAKTPNLSRLYAKYPSTQLKAHGEWVGLNANQDGNSEAGHVNIGAGRIVDQDSLYIAKCINDGTFFNNPAFMNAVRHARENKSRLHIMGLLSGEDGAHSNPDHLIALLTLARFNDIDVYLHFFTDGRDYATHAAVDLVEKISFFFRGSEKIASIMGRFYAMDRSKTWQRTQTAYETLTEGNGAIYDNPRAAILAGYNRGETDEYIKPAVIVNYKIKKGEGIINDNDSIIFYNLRSDRARQLTRAFCQTNFNKFKRKKILKNIYFVTMTDFGPNLSGVNVAFPSRSLKGTLPIALKNLRQLYIAETEKYPHITYFLNGGYAMEVVGEERVRIDSPQVDHYDQVPAMSTEKINNYVIDSIKNDKYDFIAINFACPDMIGHTGNLPAGIKAVEAVDAAVGELAKAVLARHGVLVITADHGNIEEMLNIKTNEILTKHTKNLVPFIIIGENYQKKKLRANGVLGDIAPTLLAICGVKKPKEMIRKSLLK